MSESEDYNKAWVSGNVAFERNYQQKKLNALENAANKALNETHQFCESKFKSTAEKYECKQGANSARINNA